MCGRSSLTKTEKEIEERFNASFYSDELVRYNPLPNFNVAPTHIMPVIKGSSPDKIDLYRWGLIPFWAKDEKIGYKMINARVETLLEKSAFKTAAKSRRCLVPMDGFYEWKREGKTKTPYRITMQDDSIFSAAGLWESWKNDKGEEVFSFTVITQPPNEMMKDIHNRMPAILTQEQEQQWLDNSISAEDAVSIIQPYPSDLMLAYKVDSRVGKVSENDAGLILPIDDRPELVQGSLF